MKLAVIGNGSVGKAQAKLLGVKALGPGNSDVSADIVFICVPTPTHNLMQDDTALLSAIKRVKKGLIVIRSTVLPGTTDMIQKAVDTPVVYMPEFGDEDNMEECIMSPKILVIGVTDVSSAEDETMRKLLSVIPIPNKSTIVPAMSAEFSKYFFNLWSAMQVSFGNVMYDWATLSYPHKDIQSANYIFNEAVKAVQLHPLMIEHGWDIFHKGYRGFGGKCLPKDLDAVIGKFPHPILVEMSKYNHFLRLQ